MDNTNVIPFEELKKLQETTPDTKTLDDLNTAIKLLILRLREANPLKS